MIEIELKDEFKNKFLSKIKVEANKLKKTGNYYRYDVYEVENK